jgi:radical SAM/Cys-rich protein
MTESKFRDKIRSLRPWPLLARGIEVLQVNLGYQCNMACRHCHVSAGPNRTETMDKALVDDVLRVLRENPIETLDITGGAPELNPHFRRLVSEARKAGKRVIVRTNLTIFFEPGMGDLPEFYRDHDAELVASLPCYLEENIAAVRGSGAFKKSMEALRRLNSLGFGSETAGRPLSLVYNPGGPFLPPLQSALEADYKRELRDRYGISFTRLYVFTNMPIGRFSEALVTSGAFAQYLDMLAAAFNPDTLDNIMCRSIVSVGWDGRLYDCDFNQVLGLGVDPDTPQHIRDFDHDALAKRRLTVDDHCFGCTAGQGST